MYSIIEAQKNDSLGVYLDRASNDYLKRSERYWAAKMAAKILIKKENDSVTRANYFKVANRFWNIHALEDYKIITIEIINKSSIKRDSLSCAKAYNYLGDYYRKKIAHDSAYLYYHHAEKLYTLLGDSNGTADALLNKSVLQLNENDIIGCEKTVFKALNKINDNPQLSFQAYSMLGITYTGLAEYRIAKEYYESTLKIIAESNLPTNLQYKALTFNNLGVLYQEQQLHHIAIKFFMAGLDENNLLIDHPSAFAMLTDNLAYSKLKTGELNDLPKLFQRALNIRNDLQIIPGIIVNNIHLSEYYNYIKDTAAALDYAKAAYSIAYKNGLKRDELLALKQLIYVNKKNAFQHSIKYFKINDSLQKVERLNRNKFGRIEYETEELIMEKDKLVKQRRSIISTSVVLFLGIFIVMIVLYQISKNRKLRAEQQQQFANEEIYKLMLDQQQKIEEGKQIEKRRISQELHDGVMGRLSSIRLNLFILKKKTDRDAIAKCLDHIDEIQEVEKEIRSIAHDLGKNLFCVNVNFEAIVKNLFRAIENHSDINFSLIVHKNIDWEVVESHVKMQIYRILQESLQNIDKHAHAKKVTISMEKEDHLLVIRIIDDGVGFDRKKVSRGFGLKNMKDRAKEIAATLRIDSQPGLGTMMLLKVPL